MDNDEVLIEQVAAGDSLAFSEIDSRWRSKVTAFLARKGGGNVADADELAQEVMVKVWRKAATYKRENGTFAVWIKRLARNVLVDRVRHSHRVKRGGNAVHCEYLDSEERQHEEHITDADIQQLHKAIAQLPAKLRRQCRAFLREQSTEHTSRTMACGRTTVSSHRSQAIERLREMLRLRTDESIAAVELPPAPQVQLTLFGAPEQKERKAKHKRGKESQGKLFS